MHNDHLTVRRESILLLDADPYQGLDTSATGYPTRRQWYPGTQTESCASCPDAIFLQIEVMCSGYLELIIILITDLEL